MATSELDAMKRYDDVCRHEYKHVHRDVHGPVHGPVRINAYKYVQKVSPDEGVQRSISGFWRATGTTRCSRAESNAGYSRGAGEEGKHPAVGLGQRTCRSAAVQA